MSTADPLPLAVSLTEAVEALQRELYRRLAEAGFDDIRRAHGIVFQVIDPSAGSRLTDLARDAAMTKQSMGELVAHLELHGYLVRQPDPDDRRAKILVPTARGSAAMSMAASAFDAIEATWAERIGVRQMTELRATLTSIVDSERGA